jgi:hypothetical protein
MTDFELQELMVEMDYEMTGTVLKREFIQWWNDSIGKSSVEVIHTMAEYEQVLDDADGTGQMTVIMVRWCRLTLSNPSSNRLELSA